MIKAKNTGRLFFAGEVAGFLNPMGEGISAGMESGHSIAVSVKEHFNDPNSVVYGKIEMQKKGSKSA